MAKRGKPAMSEEARENQLISLAVDRAEKMLRDGTATSQIITHYLKLASSRERIEQEILKEKKKLITAQTDNLQSQQRTEEFYQEVLDAIKSYNGYGEYEEYEEYE